MMKFPCEAKFVDLAIFFTQLILSAAEVDSITVPTASSINGSDSSIASLVGPMTRLHRRSSSFGGYGGDSDSDSDLIDQSPVSSKRFEGYDDRNNGGLRDWLVMSDEKLLIKSLLDRYETMGIVGRPVYNSTQTVKVYYGLSLIQILDVDEKNQVLTTNVWSRYTWNDVLLAWDPNEYGGLDAVRIPVSKIWTPDVVLYNYADTRLREQRETMAVVSHNGTVLWIPPAIYKSTCDIDITHFPFDEQTCHMKFGSWTYDGDSLDISFFTDHGQIDVGDYIESNEWQLIGHPAQRNVRYYPCCGDQPYPDLTFTLRIRRLSVFYNYILILPCVLLSFLTPVVFWLPPESPAKTMLGMNVFVAFFVLLILLADTSPPVATAIPLMGAYFCMNMTLITLSSFLSVVVIHAHIRVDRKNKVPPWLRKVNSLYKNRMLLTEQLIINGIGRAMCMSDCGDVTATSCRVGRHQQTRRNTSTSRGRPTQSRYLSSSSSTNHLHVAATSSSTPSSNAAYSSSTASVTARTAAASRHSNRRNIDSTVASSASAGTVPVSSIDGRLIVGAPGDHTTEGVGDCKDDDEKRRRRQNDFETNRSLTRMTSPWRLRKQLTGDGIGATVETSAGSFRQCSGRHSQGNGGSYISSFINYPSTPNDLQHSTTSMTNGANHHHHQSAATDDLCQTLNDRKPPRCTSTSGATKIAFPESAIGRRNASSTTTLTRNSSRPEMTDRVDVNRDWTMTTVSGTVPFDSEDACGAFDVTTSASGRRRNCSCSSCAAAPEAADQKLIDGDVPSSFSRRLVDDVHEIRRLLRSYSARLDDRDAREQVLAEWRLVARVLDRTFFVVYCAAIVVSMATVFPRGPS